MNFYARHIGDYLKDTAHLSLLHHGVYARLMDVYYTREHGFGQGEAHRLIGARTKEERAATDEVLAEFFTLSAADAWIQTRCDEEIAAYHDKQAKARNSARASVEARQSTAASTNRELRAARMSAAKAKGTHTAEEWGALLDFCGDRCVRCGGDGKPERDHILPVYQGGSDAIANIQPLCAQCNASKGPEAVDHRPSGWAAFVERSLNVGSAPNPIPTPITKKREKAPAAPAVTGLESVPEQVLKDFKTLRKAKRLPLTQTAIDGMTREAQKAGMSIAAAIQTSVENSWAGFKADWLKTPEAKKADLIRTTVPGPAPTNFLAEQAAHRKAVEAERLERKQRQAA